MKARSIARELALLGISQLADTSDEARQNKARQSASRGTSRRDTHQEESQTLSANQLEALLVKALAALSADVGEALETADGELQRSERLILESETRTIEADKVRWQGHSDGVSRIEPAVPLVETAINRVGGTLEFLVFAQQGDKPRIAQAQASLEESANHLHRADQLLTDTESRIADISEVREAIQRAIAAVKAAMTSLRQGLEPSALKQLIDHADIRSYATDLLGNWINHWRTVDDQLNDAMEKWSISRLARVDRDILRLAMMEIIYMDVPKRVAIDEAIEMAKRYSDEDSYRFINGVLRRTTDRLDSPELEAPSELPSESPSESPSELPAQSSESLLQESQTELKTPQDAPKPIKRAPVKNKATAASSEQASTETPLETPVIKKTPATDETPTSESLEEEPTVDEPAVEAAFAEPILEVPVLNEPSLNEPILNEPILDEPVPRPPLAEPPLDEPPLDEPPLDEINEAVETPSTENSSPEPISSDKTPNPVTPKRSIPAPIPKSKPSPQSENPWPSPE